MRRDRVPAAVTAIAAAIVAAVAGLTLLNQGYGLPGQSANADTVSESTTNTRASAAEADADAADESDDRASTLAAPDGSPVDENGPLEVCGANLCNADGDPIQLRGMSSHGIQFFPDCLNEDSIQALAEDWEVDFVRISMYVQEGGYETDPEGFTQKVSDLIDQISELGLYAVVDFHILNPGDPNFNLDNALRFFGDIVPPHADKDNVIWEIANEPNGVSWDEIKEYADEVIPVIRDEDEDAVVIVGTPAFSSLGVSEGRDIRDVIDDPIDDDNVMYAFHFYAASHQDEHRAALDEASEELPMFVSEFGTQTFTGDGDNDFDSTNEWLDLLREKQIAYAMWSFSDSDDTNSALVPGACQGDDFSSEDVLSESGRFIFDRLTDGN